MKLIDKTLLSFTEIGQSKPYNQYYADGLVF